MVTPTLALSPVESAGAMLSLFLCAKLHFRRLRTNHTIYIYSEAHTFPYSRIVFVSESQCTHSFLGYLSIHPLPLRWYVLCVICLRVYLCEMHFIHERSRVLRFVALEGVCISSKMRGQTQHTLLIVYYILLYTIQNIQSSRLLQQTQTIWRWPNKYMAWRYYCSAAMRFIRA